MTRSFFLSFFFCHICTENLKEAFPRLRDPLRDSCLLYRHAGVRQRDQLGWQEEVHDVRRKRDQ